MTHEELAKEHCDWLPDAFEAFWEEYPNSDTFDLSDRIINFHEPYFHFGGFGRCHGFLINESCYRTWFSDYAEGTENVMENLDAIIAKIESKYESDPAIRSEFEK